VFFGGFIICSGTAQSVGFLHVVIASPSCFDDVMLFESCKNVNSAAD
jgi:hypothetical protein